MSQTFYIWRFILIIWSFISKRHIKFLLLDTTIAVEILLLFGLLIIRYMSVFLYVNKNVDDCLLTVSLRTIFIAISSCSIYLFVAPYKRFFNFCKKIRKGKIRKKDVAKKKRQGHFKHFFLYMSDCVYLRICEFFYKLSSFIVTWLEFISSSMVFQCLVFIFHFCMFFPLPLLVFLSYLFFFTFSFLLLSFVSRVIHALMKGTAPIFVTFVPQDLFWLHFGCLHILL